MITKILATISVCSSLFLTATTAVAIDEAAFIADMVKAYGGESITAERSFIYKVNIDNYLFHGGRTPFKTDISAHNIVLAYDALNDAYSLEQWWHPEGGEAIHHLEIFQDDGSIRYDMRARDYQINESANAESALNYGIFMRQPFFLAQMIARNPDAANVLGEEEFYRRPHTIIELSAEAAPALKLFVDNETFQISKAEWTSTAHEVGLVTYLFGDYDRNNGVLYSRAQSIKSHGRLYHYADNIDLILNDAIASYFEVPEQFNKVEIAKNSETSVQEISPNLYLVGSNIDYTVFFNTKFGLAAYGLRRGLRARYDAYRRESGDASPLKTFVIDHAHPDHLWGLNEFAGEEGLKFIVAENHIESLRVSFEAHIPDDAIILAENDLALEGSANARLINLNTRHSEDNLVVYYPANKIILVADHIFADGRSEVLGAPYESMRSFSAKIDESGIKVDRYMTIHNSRLFSADELRAVLAQDDPEICYQNRPICAGS